MLRNENYKANSMILFKEIKMNDELAEKLLLQNCPEEVGEQFLKYLDENFISYDFVKTATFYNNDIAYAVQSIKVKNFTEFVLELQKNNIDEIFLFKLTLEYFNDGSTIYTVRYVANEDFLENNIPRLSNVFDLLEKSTRDSTVMNPSKIKKLLSAYISDESFTAFEIAKIMEFIRLFCLRTTRRKD